MTRSLGEHLAPSGQASIHSPGLNGGPREGFPGLEASFPAASWCAREELCFRLEDYLRRRTNISQWSPRGGLGRNNENLSRLRELAGVFSNGEPGTESKLIEDYRSLVRRSFDDVLARC